MNDMTGLRDHDDAVAYGDGLLAGERVRLRGTRDADLPAIAAALMDPGIRITQSRTAAPLSEAAARSMIAEWSANQGADVGFSIETLPDPPDLVGHVGLFATDLKDRSGTVGILLFRQYLGRGYGTEAMRLIVGYGFRELGLHRIELSVYGFNARAIAAYRKAGFVEEGRAREAIHHDGRWYDNVHMSILEHEWSAGRSVS
jgi:RimJ/RimL family protein N-acetyltransferase